MKLSPESVSTVSINFGNQHAEALADLIQFETNRELDEDAFDRLSTGLTDFVAELLGKLDL